MNKIEKLLEKHFTKLGCKCDVMDNTKQYQASLNAINEALTLYGVVETPLQWIKSNKVDSGEDLTIYYLPNVYTAAKWMEEYVKKHYSR